MYITQLSLHRWSRVKQKTFDLSATGVDDFAGMLIAFLRISVTENLIKSTLFQSMDCALQRQIF
jgi:hypothetical protein